MCCPLVFEFSVGIGGFVIGLGQISFFFSFYVGYWLEIRSNGISSKEALTRSMSTTRQIMSSHYIFMDSYSMAILDTDPLFYSTY